MWGWGMGEEGGGVTVTNFIPIVARAPARAPCQRAHQSTAIKARLNCFVCEEWVGSGRKLWENAKQLYSQRDPLHTM